MNPFSFSARAFAVASMDTTNTTHAIFLMVSPSCFFDSAGLPRRRRSRIFRVREHRIDAGAAGEVGSYGHLAREGVEGDPVGADRHGPGLQQVAYTVEDVEAVAETLRGRGLRVLYDEARRGTAGSMVNFVHPKDAGGVLVELVQPAASPH